MYIDHLAFADNIGLLSRTPSGLQSQINTLSEHLTKCGLYISAGQNGKSACLRINVDGKRKKWVINPSNYLHVDRNVIPAKSVTQTYRYLGLPLSAKGVVPKVTEKLQEYLNNVTKVPLKPQ